MDLWSFNDADDEGPLQSCTDASDSDVPDPQPSSKRRRVQKSFAQRKPSKLDEIDLDSLEKREEDVGGEHETEVVQSRSSPAKKKVMSWADTIAANLTKMDAPKQPTRLDPILQLEQMKAEARLAKLKQQAQEPVELSDSEDNDEEGRDAEKPSTADGQAAEGGEAQANDVKITLKIKSSEHPEGLKMRIGMHQPFSRLFAAYKAAGEDAGWLSEGTAVTFKFDGERLGSKETPESLDLEGDEVIDACW